MALKLTHMRFACDVKDDLSVTDLNKYLSGTVYPDSRYVTGVDRQLTHDKKCFEKSFYGDDDFKKGWAVHLVYDLVQGDVMNQLFPEILEAVPQGEEHGRNSWVIRSAFKMLQDIEDAQKFDISQHLSCLEYIETPHGEDRNVVKGYNDLIINLYRRAPHPNLNDLERMYVSLGVEDEVARQMKDQAVELQEDKVVLSNIKQMYQKTLEVYNEANYFA